MRSASLTTGFENAPLYYCRLDTKAGVDVHQVSRRLANLDARIRPMLESIIPATARRSSVYAGTTHYRTIVGEDLRDWNGVERVGALPSSQLGAVSVGYASDDEPKGLVDIGIDFASKRGVDIADEWSLWAHPSVASPAVLAEIVDWFIESAVEAQACTGFITFDTFARESPYEAGLGYGFLESLRLCDRFLRGYFWGNLLSAAHLDALGGRDYVLACAPVHIARDVSQPNHPLVYLQICEDDPSSVSMEQLASLREFLKPVLRPRDPHRRSGYVASKFRLVSTDREATDSGAAKLY